MKKIFVLSILFGLLYPDQSFAQNSVRLYPYQMNPSRHPDFHRYHIKSPDASFFDDKIQFIALRDLSGDYKQKLDQWVDKDKLGNILWVSYPLIFQDNLKEVVAEIKKRDLYLFDLWGYIPGSGPGGYWTQFVIPDGVLDLFETELGNRWLGMDNGEQDGRYVGAFAPRMYPMGADRKQQYFNFQRHFQEMGDQLGNKMATLVSLNFGHYFLKEGVYTLIGAETAQGLPNSQKSMDIMKCVIDKMEILGADELLISTQRTIENNYTMEKFYDSLKESFQVLSDYAEKKNIRLILRQSVNRTPDTIEGLQKLVSEVNRQNFTLAPALSMLLNDEANLDNHLSRLKQMNIKDILISAPQKDIHDQLWSTNAPVYKAGKTDTIRKILSAFPQADYIMDGLYTSQDEEYKDGKEIDKLVTKK